MSLKDLRRLSGISEAFPTSGEYYDPEDDRKAELDRVEGEMSLVDNARYASEKAAGALKAAMKHLSDLEVALDDASSSYYGKPKQKIEVLADQLSALLSDMQPFVKNALDAPLKEVFDALSSEAKDYK